MVVVPGSQFHRPTEQILLGYFWGLVIRFVPGGVIGVIGPMTPPWYKMNNQAEFAHLIFENPWYK